MRKRNWCKFSAEFLDDIEKLSFLNKRYPEYRYLKKGLKLMKRTIRFGYDGEDFVKNLITVVIDDYLKRIPRFANPLYRKNKLCKI